MYCYKTEFDDVLMKIPGHHFAELWSKKEYVHDEPTKPELLNYRQEEKDAFIADRRMRFENMRSYI